MSAYRVSPQCPASGLPIGITYAFGRLTVEIDEKYLRDNFGPEQMEGTEKDWQEALTATKLWAERVDGRRMASVEMAQHFLEREGLNGDYLERDY
jgi:hypothetical protein